MSNDNHKQGTYPASEACNNFDPNNESADLMQLLVRVGVGDTGPYLSNARIEEIVSSDADAEKRQLAARLLQLQLYADSLAAIRAGDFQHVSGGDNILNPVYPLDEFWTTGKR